MKNQEGALDVYYMQYYGVIRYDTHIYSNIYVLAHTEKQIEELDLIMLLLGKAGV